jgi:hypothetical protein
MLATKEKSSTLRATMKAMGFNPKAKRDKGEMYGYLIVIRLQGFYKFLAVATDGRLALCFKAAKAEDVGKAFGIDAALVDSIPDSHKKTSSCVVRETDEPMLIISLEDGAVFSDPKEKDQEKPRWAKNCNAAALRAVCDIDAERPVPTYLPANPTLLCRSIEWIHFMAHKTGLNSPMDTVRVTATATRGLVTTPKTSNDFKIYAVMAAVVDDGWSERGEALRKAGY